MQGREMRYEAVKELSPAAFKRLSGVKPKVFNEMVEILREAERHKKEGGTHEQAYSRGQTVAGANVLARIPHAVPSSSELRGA